MNVRELYANIETVIDGARATGLTSGAIYSVIEEILMALVDRPRPEPGPTPQPPVRQDNQPLVDDEYPAFMRIFGSSD